MTRPASHVMNFPFFIMVLITCGLLGAAELPADRKTEIEACIAALKATDPAARQAAVGTLLRPENRAHLKPLSQPIIKAAGDKLDNEQVIALLGRLEIPKQLAEKI